MLLLQELKTERENCSVPEKSSDIPHALNDFVNRTPTLGGSLIGPQLLLLVLKHCWLFPVWLQEFQESLNYYICIAGQNCFLETAVNCSLHWKAEPCSSSAYETFVPLLTLFRKWVFWPTLTSFGWCQTEFNWDVNWCVHVFSGRYIIETSAILEQESGIFFNLSSTCICFLWNGSN